MDWCNPSETGDGKRKKRHPGTLSAQSAGGCSTRNSSIGTLTLRRTFRRTNLLSTWSHEWWDICAQTPCMSTNLALGERWEAVPSLSPPSSCSPPPHVGTSVVAKYRRSTNMVNTHTKNTLKLNTTHTWISIRLQHHVHFYLFPVPVSTKNKITAEISRHIERNTHNK